MSHLSQAPVGASRTRRGFSLVELLIGLTLFGIVIAAAIGFLVAQSRTFKKLSDRSGEVQNGRFSRDLMRQEIRTAGTNVTDQQPTLVYANDSVFAFNTDLLTANADSVRFTGAVYVDRFATAGQSTAITLDRAQAIRGSVPSFTYPLTSYSQSPFVFINSDAELLQYRFVPDSSTVDPGDYVLYRQVNDGAPEAVSVGLRRSQGKPFFRYWYDPSRFGAANAELDTVPRGWLPLVKNVAQRGIAPDTGTAVTMRIDAVRSVEVVYEATPPKGTAREVLRFMVPMPNVAGARQGRACGRPPLAPTSPTVAWNADSNAVMVSWARAVDDGNGEQDAIRYVLWRQRLPATGFGDPLTTIGVVQGTTTYRYKDGGVEHGNVTYRYALAVQDCTPNVSTQVVSATVVVP